MIEHHENIKKDTPEIFIENTQEASSSFTGNLLPISIVVAGILIAGSSLYNTRAILKVLGSGSFNLKGTSQDLGTQVLQVPPSGQVPPQAPDPSLPVKVTDRSGQAVLGSKNAKVTIYEFSDFQCPFCKKFFDETYSQIKTKYIDTGKVKFVFRNYPLPFHQNAQKAAEAAECANRQGKFFPYHDLLFKNGTGDGTGLATADLKKYADQLGLNNGTLGLGKNKFNTCLDNSEAADVVKKDMTDASAIGISGTPTFIINGKQFVGAQPFANFEQTIEAALK